MEILLVEDHDDTRDIYRTIFEVEGHQVLEARDGRRGAELAIERQPDVVVLDLGLPGMDGWEVLERIREDPARDGIKVLIVTAHGDQETRRRVQQTTCNGLLIKPVEPRKLVEAVQKCMEEERVWPRDQD